MKGKIVPKEYLQIKDHPDFHFDVPEGRLTADERKRLSMLLVDQLLRKLLRKSKFAQDKYALQGITKLKPKDIYAVKKKGSKIYDYRVDYGGEFKIRIPYEIAKFFPIGLMKLKYEF